MNSLLQDWLEVNKFKNKKNAFHGSSVERIYVCVLHKLVPNNHFQSGHAEDVPVSLWSDDILCSLKQCGVWQTVYQ